MPCPCGNIAQPITSSNIYVEENISQEGYYGQTLEMLLSLQEKLICLNRQSYSENNALYLSYVKEMIEQNQPYKYDILNFYLSVIYEECN